MQLSWRDANMAFFSNTNLPMLKRKSALIIVLFCFLTTHHSQRHFTEACSSRTIPKPRPSTSSIAGIPPVTTLAPLMSRTTTSTIRSTTTSTSTTTTTTTPRPNITFPTYKCPRTYDTWYCLNEATCFTVKIGDSIMYNCECALGFMGQRCEYKELDGSFLPKRPRPLLEKASIASGAICVFLFLMAICMSLYLRIDQRNMKLYDEEEEDLRSCDKSIDNCQFRCSYCYETSSMRNFYNDAHDEIIYNDAVGKYNIKETLLLLWHQIEAFPMSFAIKRSTKL